LRERNYKILYPVYFDARATRSEGRRVPLNLAVKRPKADDILVALRKMGIKAEISGESHPSRWFRREGRVIAETGMKKTRLIREVARKLKEAYS
jgi:signal recognition particle subunit SRP19